MRKEAKGVPNGLLTGLETCQGLRVGYAELGSSKGWRYTKGW